MSSTIDHYTTFQLRAFGGSFGFGSIEETLSPNNNAKDNKTTRNNVRSFVALSLSRTAKLNH